MISGQDQIHGPCSGKCRALTTELLGIPELDTLDCILRKGVSKKSDIQEKEMVKVSAHTKSWGRTFQGKSASARDPDRWAFCILEERLMVRRVAAEEFKKSEKEGREGWILWASLTVS